MPTPVEEAVARLQTFYNGDDYTTNSPSNLGGFGDGGHRVNFIPAIQDVALVVADLGISSAALTRLASYYTGTNYNAGTNPGGMARGGHRINFEPALFDLVVVGRVFAAEAIRTPYPSTGTATATATAVGRPVYAVVGTASATATAAAVGEDGATPKLWLVDGSSSLLLVDGVSELLLVD